MKRVKSGVKNAIAFLIVGPPIGVLTYSLWGWALAGGDGAMTLPGVIWLLPFGYLLGGLPAAVTGFLAGLLVEPARPIRYLAVSTLVGAATAGCVALIDVSEPSSMEGVINLTGIGALASLGAAGARLLFNHLRPGPISTSS